MSESKPTHTADAEAPASASAVSSSAMEVVETTEEASGAAASASASHVRAVSFNDTPTMFVHETLLPLADENEFYSDSQDYEEGGNISRADFSSSSSLLWDHYERSQHVVGTRASVDEGCGMTSIDEEMALTPSSPPATTKERRKTSLTMETNGEDDESSEFNSYAAGLSVDSFLPVASIRIANKQGSSKSHHSNEATASAIAPSSMLDDEGKISSSCALKKSSSLIRRAGSKLSREEGEEAHTATASMTHGTKSASVSSARSRGPFSALSRLRQRFHSPVTNRQQRPQQQNQETTIANQENQTQLPKHRQTHSAPQKSRTQRLVLRTKILFFSFLLLIATLTSILLYTKLTSTEITFAKSQFQSIAKRAVLDSADVVSRKRLSMATMAAMISEQYRDAERDWPEVAVVGYERIVDMLARTGGHTNMGFAPIVKVSEQPEFETFAYDYFGSQPHFPPTTGIQPFGKGIWRMNKNKTRIHDNDATTQERQILTPIIQCCIDNPGDGILLFNLHSEPSRRKTIDGIIKCSEKIREETAVAEAHSTKNLLQATATTKQIHTTREHIQASTTTQEEVAAISSNINNDEVATTVNSQLPQPTQLPKSYPDYSCGSMTEFVNIVRFKTRGPASIMFQPIYPADSSWVVRGLVLSPMAWDEVFEAVFSTNMHGIHAVLESETQKWTYLIEGGLVESFHEGDIHETKYDEYAVSVNLTWQDLHEMGAPMYKLTLYPTDCFIQSFSTENPRGATIAALSVIIFISILFLLYDYYVRREFMERHQLLEAKRRFIRYVSHEVRTPLNAVLMGLNIIEAEMEVDEPAQLDSDRLTERLELLHEIQNSTESAVDVLNDVLLYDKIESHVKLDISMVPIWQVVERTLGEFKLPAARRGVSLRATYETAMGATDLDVSEYDAGLRVKNFNDLPEDVRCLRVAGDASRIAQVLRNLFSNALKFTSEEGLILVTASYHAKNIGEDRKAIQWKQNLAEKFELHNGQQVSAYPRGHLHLKVQDTGVGMTQDQIGKLFGEGVQFNAHALQDGKGSGLGLFIAKGLVEQHKGTLHATSDGLDQGAVFTLKLPLYHVPGLADERSRSSSSIRSIEKDALSSVAASEDPSWSEKKLRLLVVDNAPANRKFLSRLLERKGHKCDMAENGQVAFERVRENMNSAEEEPYDSILIDYEMPVMNGPTATGLIRELGSDVFIVGITGNVLSDDVQYFKSKGANAILTKPLQLSALEDLFMEYHLSY